MKNIYVLGSLNMDLVIHSKRVPEKGETIVGSNFHACPGGKGLNQAIAASKLGGNVKMLGAVGDDLFGKMMMDGLKQNNVDIKNIKVLRGKSSGIAHIMLINSDNRIIVDLATNLLIRKNDIDTFLAKANESDIFLTQCENNLDAIGYALKVAKSKKMITVVNPAPANINILQFSNDIDILIPNETELKILSGSNSIEKAYKKLFIPNLLVTLGENGYSTITETNSFSGIAKKVKVVDTTGAGDCFIGALCYQLSLISKLNKEAADFACKAATISVTKLGSSIASPTLEEMK